MWRYYFTNSLKYSSLLNTFQAQLSEKLEEARNFQSEVEGFKQDQCRVVQEYESMKKKYRYVTFKYLLLLYCIVRTNSYRQLLVCKPRHTSSELAIFGKL